MREMKDSEIDWIGKIPKNWQIKRLKNVLYERKENNNPVKTNNILSLTNDRGVIPYYEKGKQGNKAKEDLTGYKLAYPNDIILNSMNVVIGSVNISNYFGCVSPVYYMLYTNKYNIKYYNYIFQTNTFQNSLKGLGNGILEIRMRIPMEKLNNVLLPIPVKDEQDKIADFLDKKITEIDNVIKKTKQTIEDYNIYKQSIIFKCVTSGIKRNEKEKCMINWIKEKPVNWKILKISQIFSQVKSKNKDLVEKNLLSLSYGKVKRRNIDAKEGLLPENFEGYNIIEEDDIVLRLTDLQNDHKSLRVGRNIERGIITSAYITIRNKLNKDSRYYYYLLHSFDICKGFYGMGSGVRQGLTFEEIKKMEILVPPNDEQNDIANYLDKQSQMIEKLILQKEKLIEELEQYKKSIIYEYATGKKEVREKKVNNTDNTNGIKINCKDNIFAQAILLCKIIEKLRNDNLGRVKAEKTLYLIEKEVGFDFNNKYVREAAGPLSDNIYKCESIISKKNKWVNIKKVKKHIEYEILPNFHKYSQYYDKYFSSYDSQIEKIMDIVKNYSTDKAEMVATLYAAWNDFIIKKDKVSDIEIVKDVRENWNDRKKRFNEKEWIEVLEEMKRIGLTPKGNGNLTVIKE